MTGQKPDLEAKLLEAQQHLSDAATKFTQLFSLMGVAKDPEHRKMLEKSAASLQQSMDVWGARVAELGKATIQVHIKAKQRVASSTNTITYHNHNANTTINHNQM